MEEKRKEEIYKKLGRITEDIFFNLGREQKTLYLRQVDQYLEETKQMLNRMLDVYSEKEIGKIVKEQKRKVQSLYSDYETLCKDIGGKFKIYIRGCGNAGKSTLLNALLGVDENTGSKMDKKPMTFTIDTFTDELSFNEAVIRTIKDSGKIQEKKMSRKEAQEISKKERDAFEKSKKRCNELKRTRLKDVVLQEERNDIEKDIYENNLLKTSIREIKWGIGKNDFLHDCLLIDTPGLSQELRFTNVIEDVKNYEADGIIWVISSKGIYRQDTKEAYIKELRIFEDLYKGKRVMAVINIMSDFDEMYTRDSKEWHKFERAGRKLFGEKFEDIICVNNFMAYEGYLEKDRKKIEDSNIQELKNKINERFIEKSSNDYLNREIEKIHSFRIGVNEVLEEHQTVLKNILNRYKTITGRIDNVALRCRGDVIEKQRKIINYYCSLYRQRLEENASFVQNFRQYSESERENFLKEAIIQNNDLDKKLIELRNILNHEFYKRFKDMRKECIVSDYETQEYAYKKFKEKLKLEEFAVELEEIDVSGAMLENLYDSFNSFIANISFDSFSPISSLKTIFSDAISIGKKIWKRLTVSYLEQLTEKLEEWVEQRATEYALSWEIRQYEKECKEIRTLSMIDFCAEKDIVEEIINAIEQEKNEKKWGLQEIGLLEILVK